MTKTILATVTVGLALSVAPVHAQVVERTALPLCEPGDGNLLFTNWPCDPQTTFNPPPTPSPTVSPCPQCQYLPPPPQPAIRYCPGWAWWCANKPIVANYLALGDSVAYGLISIKGYVFRYQAALEARLGGTVDTQNMSAPGVSSEIMLTNLTSNTIMQERISHGDYITWNVGGKDLLDARDRYQTGRCGGEDNQSCLRRTSAALKNNWNSIVTEIQGLRQPTATVATMDIYNPFVEADRARDSWPNDAGSDFAVFKPYLDDVNQHIRRHSPAIKVAPVYFAFNGPDGEVDPATKDLISFDGFHPNNKGHKLIADLLLIRPVAR